MWWERERFSYHRVNSQMWQFIYFMLSRCKLNRKEETNRCWFYLLVATCVSVVFKIYYNIDIYQTWMYNWVVVTTLDTEYVFLILWYLYKTILVNWFILFKMTLWSLYGIVLFFNFTFLRCSLKKCIFNIMCFHLVRFYTQ